MAQDPVPAATLQHTRGICSSVWSPVCQVFGGEVMLHLHPAVLFSLIICKQSVLGSALRGLYCSSEFLPDSVFSSLSLLQAPL